MLCSPLIREPPRGTEPDSPNSISAHGGHRHGWQPLPTERKIHRQQKSARDKTRELQLGIGILDGNKHDSASFAMSDLLPRFEKEVPMGQNIVKVVYFDEGSATDFVQIAHGGGLKTTTQLFESSKDEGRASAEAEAKLSLGDLLQGLLGAKLSAGVDASITTSFDSGEVAKSIITNTLLTDFLACVEPSSSFPSVEIFRGFDIVPVNNSMSSFMLLTPYLGMLRGGSSVSAGDFAISLDRIDDAIKKAKGYYEFLAIRKDEPSDRRLLRFNGSALKNNYKLTDLTKMDLLFYAVKVGKSSMAELDITSELELTGVGGGTKNPDYPFDGSAIDEIDEGICSDLDMYDVILAGVQGNE